MNFLTKLSLTAIASMFVVACQGGNSAYIGEGPIQLSPNAQSSFNRYLKSNGMIFAVTEDGKKPFYHYCPHLRCGHLNMVETLYLCKQRHGKTCKVYAMDDQIVWRFPEEKSIEQALVAAKSRILDTDWSDVVDDHQVTIDFEAGMSAKLSMTSEPTGTCNGNVEFESSKDKSRFPGEWNLSCEKGQTATGNLTITATHYGELQFIGGRGEDSQGNPIGLYLAD